MQRRPNGLLVGQMRIPLGVIGIIYEARPNVTADAAALALKAGNAVILKGGREAIKSNKAIVAALHDGLRRSNLPVGCVSLIENTDRQATVALMKLDEYVDVLIPRGGPGLIRAVVEQATIPVIETGAGNCHTYVDKTADLEMARQIVVNAKCHRPGVCNALETLLVDQDIAEDFLPTVIDELIGHGVEVRGSVEVMNLHNAVMAADSSDWSTEYLDDIIAIKTVADLDEAIDHINTYGTGHSEAIVTRDYASAQQFINAIDAAAVYVNASTRFTDGFEFGLGAEMGISTQKMHARGPMGLHALTGLKYVIQGSGQIRK